MKLVSLYDFDPTGVNGANKVINESVTIVPPGNIRDVSFFCPRAAPFFANSMVIKTGTGIGARTLIEDIDYRLVFDFVSASIHLKRRINVGVALLNPEYAGTLYLTYQALGGEYSLADYSVFEEILRERYSSVHVAYEQIVNLPPGFATAWHQHAVNDLVGMREVVAELVKIKEAIKSKPGSFGQLNQLIEDHLNTNTAHSPREVGLGNVMNYGVATQEDINANRPDKYLTANLVPFITSGIRVDTSSLASKQELEKAIKTVESKISKAVTDGISIGNFATKTEINTINNQFNDYLRKDDMTAIQTIHEILPDYNTANTSINLVDILNGANIANRKKIASGRAVIRINKNGSDNFTLNVGNHLYVENGNNIWKEGCQVTIFNNSSTAKMTVRVGTYTREVDVEHAVSLIKINGNIEIIGGNQAIVPITDDTPNITIDEVSRLITESTNRLKTELTELINSIKNKSEGTRQTVGTLRARVTNSFIDSPTNGSDNPGLRTRTLGYVHYQRKQSTIDIESNIEGSTITIQDNSNNIIVTLPEWYNNNEYTSNVDINDNRQYIFDTPPTRKTIRSNSGNLDDSVSYTWDELIEVIIYRK